MDDLEDLIFAEAAAAVHGQASKTDRSSVSGSLEGAALDAVASNLLPAHRDDPNRDRKDAENADTAFTAILAALVTAVEGSATAANVAASILTLGGATAPLTTFQAAVGAAAIAVRVAWGRMSVQDRARIWRGEVG